MGKAYPASGIHVTIPPKASMASTISSSLMHAWMSSTFHISSYTVPREIRLLALANLVNRAGTMVVPFLSLYLTRDMGLTLEEVGWIVSCFGAGSVVGSWLGGRLTDKLGFHRVMVGALLTSTAAFIALRYLHGFVPFCVQKEDQAALIKATESPYRDKPYLFFLLTMVLICIPFLQYFSTVPLFYSRVHGLSEEYIGLLLGSNGLLISFTEMALVKYCESRPFGLHAIMHVSVLLFALSFAILVLFPRSPSCGRASSS